MATGDEIGGTDRLRGRLGLAEKWSGRPFKASAGLKQLQGQVGSQA